MTVEQYIAAQLSGLAEPGVPTPLAADDQVEKAVIKALLSRKFRKYAVSEPLLAHIREAVRLNVAKRQPINLTFLNGAYKLWRLEESPEVDWAEFFTVIHYTKWLAPI